MSDEIRERYRKRGISYWEMVNKYLSNKQETGEKANANVVNTVLALSCELLLKSMIDEQEITHELKNLYEELPDELKSEISISDENLEDINNAFDSRYPGFLKGNTNILYFFASNLADISKRNGEDISPKLDILPSLDVANNVEIYKNWFELGNAFNEMCMQSTEENLYDVSNVFLAFSNELFLKSIFIKEWIEKRGDNATSLRKLNNVLKKNSWSREYPVDMHSKINHYPLYLQNDETFAYATGLNIHKFLESKGITFSTEKVKKSNSDGSDDTYQDVFCMNVNGKKYGCEIVEGKQKVFRYENTEKGNYLERIKVEPEEMKTLLSSHDDKHHKFGTFEFHPNAINLEINGAKVVTDRNGNYSQTGSGENLYSNFDSSEIINENFIKNEENGFQPVTSVMSHNLRGLFETLSPFNRYLIIGYYCMINNDFGNRSVFDIIDHVKTEDAIDIDNNLEKEKTLDFYMSNSVERVKDDFVNSRYDEFSDISSRHQFLANFGTATRQAASYFLKEGFELPIDYHYRKSNALKMNWTDDGTVSIEEIDGSAQEKNRSR